MELGMPQVNMLPLELHKSADISSDKASFSSSSSRGSGYKNEALDHFSGLVDKHLQDKKNETRRKIIHTHNKDNDYQRNANNSEKLSDENSINTDKSKNPEKRTEMRSLHLLEIV